MNALQEATNNLEDCNKKIKLLTDNLEEKDSYIQKIQSINETKAKPSNIEDNDIIKTQLEKSMRKIKSLKNSTLQYQSQIDTLKSQLHTESLLRNEAENNTSLLSQELQLTCKKHDTELNLANMQMTSKLSLLQQENSSLADELIKNSSYIQSTERELKNLELDNLKYLRELETMKLNFEIEKQSLAENHQLILNDQRQSLENHYSILLETAQSSEIGKLRNEILFKDSELMSSKLQLEDEKCQFNVY